MLSRMKVNVNIQDMLQKYIDKFRSLVNILNKKMIYDDLFRPIATNVFD